MSIPQLEDAKAGARPMIELSASELNERAVDQPMQTVTFLATSEQLKVREQNLGDFLRASPLYGLDLDFSRDKSLPRDISLD